MVALDVPFPARQRTWFVGGGTSDDYQGRRKRSALYMRSLAEALLPDVLRKKIDDMRSQ